MRSKAVAFLIAMTAAINIPVMQTSAQQSSCSVGADVGLNSSQVDLIPAGGFGFFDDDFFDVYDDGVYNTNYDLESLTEDQYAEVLIPSDDAIALRLDLVKGYRYRFCVTYYNDPTEEGVPGPPVGDVYLLASGDFDIYRTDYDTRMETWWSEGLEQIPLEWRDMATWLPFRDVHAYESIQQTEFTTSIDSEQEAFIDWFGNDPENYMYLVLDNWNSSRPGSQSQAGVDLIAEVTIDVEKRVMLPAITAYAIVCLPPILLIAAPAVIHSRFHGWKDKNAKEEDFGRSVPLVEGDLGLEKDGDLE